jgi:hypothetical protein
VLAAERSFLSGERFAPGPDDDYFSLVEFENGVVGTSM